MPKIIQDSDIENLKKLIRNRNRYHDIKEVLDNLEDLPNSPEQSEGDALSPRLTGLEVVQSPSPSGDTMDILKDLKELLHRGKRSQIHEFEIRDIINKYSKE